MSLLVSSENVRGITPFGSLENALFFKLHYLIDKKIMIFWCLTDDDRYLQNLENYWGSFSPQHSLTNPRYRCGAYENKQAVQEG